MRAFVGPNADYYLGKWRQMEAAGSKSSWNWPAFFLSCFWLAYRKMYVLALAIGAAMFLCQLAQNLFRGPPAYAGAGLMFGLAVWVGLNGNRLYRVHAEQTMAQAGAAGDPSSAGGTSIGAALGLLAIWMVTMTGILMLFALYL